MRGGGGVCRDGPRRGGNIYMRGCPRYGERGRGEGGYILGSRAGRESGRRVLLGKKEGKRECAQESGRYIVEELF